MGNNNETQIYKRDTVLAELISTYEDSVKAEERITKWHGDYGVNEIKYTAPDELVKEKADKALEILGMSYNDYMKRYKESSTDMKIRLKEAFGAHQEVAKVTRQEFIENPEPTEPVITIEYSENEQLKDGIEMPLSMADKIFNDLSMQNNVSGIEEVIYTIKYVLDGKEKTYEGSIYTGDKIGGVVDHISHFGSFFRNNAAYQDYLKRKETPEEIEKLNASYEYNSYKLEPYLRAHINLLKIEQSAKEEIDILKKLDLSNAENYQKFEYNHALQEYVKDFRQVLNSGDWNNFPEMPKLEDFEMENMEESVKEPDILVAIESTDDHTDYYFTPNMRNTRGVGKEDYYRIVYVNETASLEPLTEDVFNSKEEALENVGNIKGAKLVEYDELIHNALELRKIPDVQEKRIKYYSKLDQFEADMKEAGWYGRHICGQRTYWYHADPVTENVKEIEFNDFDSLQNYLNELSVYNKQKEAQEVFYDEVQSEATKVHTNDENLKNEKSEYAENLRKTKEQYTAQKKEELSKINVEIHEITDNFQQNPETIAELLEFGTKFHKYSVRNQMLIMKQNRGATYLKSYADWKKDGYNVKRGEKGLKILAPVKVTYLKQSENNFVKLSEAPKELQQLYKLGKIASIQKTYYTVGTVFDISQTTCPVEKYPEYYGMGYQNHDQNKMIDGIIAYSEKKLGIPVEVKDFSSISLRGCYYPDTKEIKLNALLKTTEKMSTLVHELGHAVMEHSSDRELSTYQKEFEADCFSIMLNKHFGIELTERRRSHLSKSYNAMKNDYIKSNTDFEFDKIVGDVFKRYNNVVEDIDKYIDEQLNKEMDIPQNLEQEKVTSIFNDYQNPSIYDKMIASYNTELLDNRYEMEMA